MKPTNNVGLKINVPAEDGVSVIVFVQVAPAGIVTPLSRKDVPRENPEFVQGLPTAN